jgi:hypothetical protein
MAVCFSRHAVISLSKRSMRWMARAEVRKGGRRKEGEMERWRIEDEVAGSSFFLNKR